MKEELGGRITLKRFQSKNWKDSKTDVLTNKINKPGASMMYKEPTNEIKYLKIKHHK